MVKIPEQLLGKMKMGRCVLFLGAGASFSSGAPLGSGFSEYLRDNVVFRDEDYSEDLLVYVESIQDKVSRREIELAIKKRLQNLQPSQGYYDLSALPWKSIYSTNFDVLTEESYKKSRLFSLTKINKFNQLDVFGGYDVPLYKLHGCIDEVYDPSKPLVLTYSELLSNKEKKKDFIQRLTNDLIDSILFVGYSFNDQLIVDILNEFKVSSQWNAIGEKYAVLPTPKQSDVVRYKTYGVQVIDATFDNFFKTVRQHFEEDEIAKLKILRRSLSIKFGVNTLELSANVKNFLDTYFDYYNPEEDYRVDPLYFYRGGKPGWGDIVNKLDIERDIFLSDNYDSNNKVGMQEVLEMLERTVYGTDPKFIKIKLSGPAAVGKTTFIYRLNFELMQRGILSLIYRDLGDIRKGVLAEIYAKNQQPFVIFIDSAASAGFQISSVINEIVENNLPVVLVLATRESDWEIFLDQNIKRRIGRFHTTIRMNDSLSSYQCGVLVDKLIDNNVVSLTPERNRKELISLFNRSRHLMVSLMEVIENTSFDKAISSEYDNLKTDLAKNAYGLVSLVSRYGSGFKWELLQRTLNNLYKTDWSDFIENIVRTEGKDIIREEGVAPNYFYTCRHSMIAEKISLIHFKDSISDELYHLKKIVESVNKGTNEEYFINKLIYLLIQTSEDKGYEFDVMIELINTGIEVVADPSYLLQVKGQYLLDNGKAEEALLCFEKNVDDNARNRMVSLHSKGMAHFSLAKSFSKDNGRRQLEIKKAKDNFWNGIKDYQDNTFFYRSMLGVLSMRLSEGELTDSDLKLLEKVMDSARRHLTTDYSKELEDFENTAASIISAFLNA